MQSTQPSTVASLQQRVKDLFTEDVTTSSPYAKELYKAVRNKVKKLQDIQNAEDKLREQKGAKLSDVQAEKLKNKETFMQSVIHSLEAFEVYKKIEYEPLVAQR